MLFRLLFTGLLAFVPLVAHALGSVSGTYASDNRPREILFLALTQSKNNLSGSLTIVSPDGNGGTAARTQDLVGIVDGDHIDLKSDALHFDGTRKGNALLLSASATNGDRFTYRFNSMNEGAFNGMLTEWRRGLFAAHEQATREAAAQSSERNSIIALSKELDVDIYNMKNTGIPTDLSDMEMSIRGQRSAIQAMKTDLIGLKRDAAVIPMTCHQANQAVYDYSQTLSYDFQQTLGYSVSNYRNAKAKLEKRLANGPSFFNKVAKDAAALQEALRASKFHTQTDSGSLVEAKEEVAKYQALASDAQSRLPMLQAEVDSIIEEAKGLMADGKSIAQRARSIVACR